MNPELIINELRIDENKKAVFYKLLNCSQKFDESWQPILVELLETIGSNPDPQNSQILLASHVFSMISASLMNDLLIKTILNLNDSKLSFHDRGIIINDLEPFKLIFIHGYLAFKSKAIYSPELHSSVLSFIIEHCKTYTKYSHFSFKLLKNWLKKSVSFNYWEKNDPSIEKELEVVVFSNWDNSISEIAKINSTLIFPIYLQVMNKKYPGFLDYVFKQCRFLSWQNRVKFTILAEVVKIWKGIPQFEESDLKIFLRSLEENHLKHESTVLYLALLNKIDNEDDWLQIIKDPLCSVLLTWEKNEKVIPLRLIWDLWIKPTITKFGIYVVRPLLSFITKNDILICFSYLFKLALEFGIPWKSLMNSSYEYVMPFLDDNRDFMCVNIFSGLCTMFLGDKGLCNPFFCLKFLYFNANTTSIHVRKEMFRAFEILFNKIIKSNTLCHNEYFIEELHKFIMDCLNTDSCYQRKIIGLKLYEIVLSCFNCPVNPSNQKESKKAEKSTRDGPQMKEMLKKANLWTWDNEKSLGVLLKLCSDEIEEVREIASNILITYFDFSILTRDHIKFEIYKLKLMINSPKFYESFGGVKLLSVLIASNHPDANSLGVNLVGRFLDTACKSLQSLKKDFVKSLRTGFNSSLIVLLKIGFTKPFIVSLLSSEVLNKMLDFLEEATEFFLSSLSPKSSANKLYSSSFAEMGIAIEEIIEKSELKEINQDSTVLSSAHQLIVSYIWLGLKTLCELSAKLTTLDIGFDEKKRLLDVIVSVLLKCRHKGAIESAGNSLGLAMQTLSSKEEFNPVFDAYLDGLLNLDSKDYINTTRRGAGLSIMFHKILMHDNKRRLLNPVVNKLLFMLKNPSSDSAYQKRSDQDSPQARQLHFLKTIVADRSLNASLAPFIEEISLICFKHLKSSDWAVRNASLQLLGSIIPRLAGSNEGSFDFANGFLVNYFIIHYPKLADFIMENLEKESAFKVDGNVVPILTLVSKMSVGGCDLTDLNSYSYIYKMKYIIYNLFEHPVDTVRYLAAKSYAALTFPKDILSNIIKLKTLGMNKNRNFIHGCLLAQICLHLLLQKTGNLLDEEMYKLAGQIDVQQLQNILFNLNNQQSNENIISSYIIESTFIQNLLIYPNLSNINDLKLILRAEELEIILNSIENDGIGASELIDRIIQLNSKLGNLNDKYISLCKSDSEAVSHSAMRYLNPSKSSSTVSERLTLLNDLLIIKPKDLINSNFIVELADLLIRIFDHDAEIRNNYFKEEDYKLTKSLVEFVKRMQGIQKQCKSQRIHRLIYKIIAFIPYHDSSLPDKQNLMDYIAKAVEGDELEKMNAIDCLVLLNSLDLNISHQVTACESIAILLNDEDPDIRWIVTKKSQKYSWIPFTKKEMHKLPQVFLHRIIQFLIYSVSVENEGRYLKSINKISGKKPIISNAEHAKLMTISKDHFESPFDHDQSYKENSRVRNIFFAYFVDFYSKLDDIDTLYKLMESKINYKRFFCEEKTDDF